MSSEIPLFPSVPGKGAIIFPLFKWAITSPFLTSSSKFIGFNNSSFFILNEVVFFERAVPKDSILFENYLFLTTTTIIPGGGFLLNFFLKCDAII